MSADDLVDAVGQHVLGLLGDMGGNNPTVRHYLGVWQGSESIDSNLSVVQLQGGTLCRFVPKLSHVSGLAAGSAVILVSAPTVPMHIAGVLVGDIAVAQDSTASGSAPLPPTGLTVTGHTTSSLSLSWTASTPGTAAIAGYDVYVGGAFKQTASGTSSTVSGLAGGTTYPLAVRARDAAGNVSGLSVGVNGTTDTPAAPGLTTYTKSYAATWSRSFNYNGSNEYDSWHGSTAYQGQLSAGNQKAMIGFNYSQIQSDLAGSTAVQASIRLSFAHWYYNSGGTAVLGTHNASSAPSSFSGSTGLWTSGNWPVGGTRTVNLGSGICGQFRDGTVKGIVLGPGPSSSALYYGYAYGAGSGVYVPLLTLTYTK